jgi:hypothetical protein
MDATVSNILQRLADLYATIDNVTTTYPFVPRQVPHSELPAIVLWPGSATYATSPRRGANEIVIRRNYTALALLEPANTGTETEGQQRVLDYGLFDNVLRTFGFGNVRNSLILNGVPLKGITETIVTGDTGLVVRAYPFNTDQQYIAVEFTHQIETIFGR